MRYLHSTIAPPLEIEMLKLVDIGQSSTFGHSRCVTLETMNDTELERAIRRAGYDICWEAAPDGGEPSVYALRDGKRHTRSHATLLALAEYLGRVERPARFVDDSDALDSAIAAHAEERNVSWSGVSRAVSRSSDSTSTWSSSAPDATHLRCTSCGPMGFDARARVTYRRKSSPPSPHRAPSLRSPVSPTPR